MGFLQNLFFRQEGGEMLCLIQTSKARGGHGTVGKAHVATSSTCSWSCGDECQGGGWGGRTPQVTGQAWPRASPLRLLLSVIFLFGLEHEHNFQNTALISLRYYNSTLNDTAKSQIRLVAASWKKPPPRKLQEEKKRELSLLFAQVHATTSTTFIFKDYFPPQPDFFCNPSSPTPPGYIYFILKQNISARMPVWPSSWISFNLLSTNNKIVYSTRCGGLFGDLLCNELSWWFRYGIFYWKISAVLQWFKSPFPDAPQGYCIICCILHS